MKNECPKGKNREKGTIVYINRFIRALVAAVNHKFSTLSTGFSTKQTEKPLISSAFFETGLKNPQPVKRAVDLFSVYRISDP